MHHIKNRQCQHCHAIFIPDYRNRRRQKFCSLPVCKQASKKASQQGWYANNTEYFKEDLHVKRVQEWRRAHPGYRKSKGKKDVLQEICPPNTTGKQDNIELKAQSIPTDESVAPVLQDFLTAQQPVLIGFIMQLTGLVLQDDIAKTVARLAQLGKDFLNGLPAVPAAPVSPVLTRGWAQRFRKLFCNTALFCQGV